MRACERVMRFGVAMLIVASMAPQSAMGATVYADAGGVADWNTDADWNAAAPNTSDDVYIGKAGYDNPGDALLDSGATEELINTAGKERQAVAMCGLPQEKTLN